MALMAAIIDSREPAHIQSMTMGGAPVSVAMLAQGDAMLACDDNEMVLVERKSLDDLLGSIKSNRIFNQIADMSTVTRWCYLVVTDPLAYGPGGNLITARGETGWSFHSVEGALLTLQELGAFVVFCAGEQDYENCLLRIAARSRDREQVVEPAKIPHILSAQEQVLAALPGLGVDRVRGLLELFETPAQALAALTDLKWPIPGIAGGIKAKVRNALKLAESEQLIVSSDSNGQERVEIYKNYIQEKVNG
jgi:ERCC4-type nuclease